MWSGVGPRWYFDSVFSHQGAFSRSSPFLADSLTKDVCGVSVRCINEPGFWTILLAGYLLYLLIFRLTGSTLGAALGATGWVLSIPVLDAFGWQATMGDRLAALFGVASVHAALSAMHALDRRATIGRAALGNVLVVLPVIVTYNSKEISWLLLPSLLLLAVALTDDWSLRRILVRASVLSTSAAYVVFRTIDAFVLIGESSSSRSLDFGGFPPHNANLYSAYLANRLSPSTLTQALAALVLFAMLAVTTRYRKADGQLRSQIQVLAWAALSFIGGLTLCLFTPSPGPYLMLLPATFLWVGVVALWRATRVSNRLISAGGGVCLAAATAIVMVTGLNSSYGLYGEVLKWSHNFRRSLPAVARNVPVGAQVDFVIGEAPFVAYRFVGEPGQRFIDQFVYHKTGLFTAAESRMANVPGLSSPSSGYSIVLGPDLSVAKILRGPQLIYRGAAP
jgi:hypothetical protein